MADFDWPSRRMVDLELLVDLCTSVDSWLRADVNNVVVIHCTVSVLCVYCAIIIHILEIVCICKVESIIIRCTAY